MWAVTDLTTEEVNQKLGEMGIHDRDLQECCAVVANLSIELGLCRREEAKLRTERDELKKRVRELMSEVHAL